MQVSNDDMTKLVSRNPAQGASGTSPPGPAAPKTEPSAQSEPRQTAPPPPAETLFSAVENINQVLKAQERSVRLKASEFAETAVIEVIDKETDTVIRQIPAESTMKLAEYWSQNGLLADGSLISLSVDETA
ncbi:MAG: flagellar protein FlaG [Pseudomonadota bacterium]